VIQSRIDPMSWLIHVDDVAPAEPIRALFDAPSARPVMRPVIHECVHFWHSISTAYGIRLAFDCLQTFNSLRFAARKGADLRSIPADWEFDGYRPFAVLEEVQGRGVQTGPLSPNHLFEGLARYWDTVTCAGFSTDRTIRALLEKDSDTYARAFSVAQEELGNVAFILFPFFAYFALCTDDAVESFGCYLQNYRRAGFAVPKGNFQLAWHAAWTECSTWKGLAPRPYGPMSTYRRLHRRYVHWKSRYAGLVPEDFPLTGHPILEDYIQNMMAVARERSPNRTQFDLEPMMIRAFACPGDPAERSVLIERFFPPLIQFRGGLRWTTSPPRFKDPAKFAESMGRFSALMGAAFGVLSRARQMPLQHACPHRDCSVHADGLCSYVLEPPRDAATCPYRTHFRDEFGIA
jgi:hypothetical protein